MQNLNGGAFGRAKLQQKITTAMLWHLLTRQHSCGPQTNILHFRQGRSRYVDEA